MDVKRFLIRTFVVLTMVVTSFSSYAARVYQLSDYYVIESQVHTVDVFFEQPSALFLDTGTTRIDSVLDIAISLNSIPVESVSLFNGFFLYCGSVNGCETPSNFLLYATGKLFNHPYSFQILDGTFNYSSSGTTNYNNGQPDGFLLKEINAVPLPAAWILLLTAMMVLFPNFCRKPSVFSHSGQTKEHAHFPKSP